MKKKCVEKIDYFHFLKSLSKQKKNNTFFVYFFVFAFSVNYIDRRVSTRPGAVQIVIQPKTCTAMLV